MVATVLGVLSLFVCSVCSHYAYDYSPVYHQQSIAYVQQPAIYHASPIATPVAPVTTLSAASPVLPVAQQVEYVSAPAKYDFSYGVHDSLTGDIKSQRESRDGGNVEGSYSLIDADGYKRTVTYTADDVNGFNAVVQREPLAGLASPIVAAQYPQSEYLPVSQIPVAAAPISIPVAPAPLPVQLPAPAEVPVAVEDSSPVEQPIEQFEPAPLQPEEVQPSEQDVQNNLELDDNDDTEVIDAFETAATAKTLKNNVSNTESSLNQGEVAPQ